jgi:hypothetical protein
LSFGGLVAAAASALFWGVIQYRLAGFDRPSGMPQSWEGRWDNLQRFFLPDLLSNFGWLMGVRPVPRVPAPEAWREWVYIESGYVWLLWIGGLPFLIAFFVFVAVSARRLWRVTCERSDAAGAAAVASLSFLVVVVVLMMFDPHLTGRGSADLFYPLLALSLTPTGRTAGWCVRSSGQHLSAGAGVTGAGVPPGHLPEPAYRGCK